MQTRRLTAVAPATGQPAGPAQGEDGFVALFPADGPVRGWAARKWNEVKEPADAGVLWNQVTCQGPRVKVVLNGTTILDLNLDQQTKLPKRHDGTYAPALKDRPRTGHIGFQELSRGGGHVQIRNARIKILP